MPEMDSNVSELLGVNTSNNPGVPTSYHYGARSRTKKSLLLSQGHYGWPQPPGNRNVGGSFILYRQIVDFGYLGVPELTRGNQSSVVGQQYNGGLTVNIAWPAVPSGFIPDSRGAEAYQKMKPTKPTFGALNSFYELREFLPLLKQSFEIPRRARIRDRKNNRREITAALKDIGSAHLALQFGWLPLLSDVRNFVFDQDKVQKKLDFLLRNNGKPVRTTATLADFSTERVRTSGANYGSWNQVLHTGFYNTQPTFVQEDWSEERWWASARYRFWLPPGIGSVHWKAAMIARLNGLMPSPSVIYNGIPWTWLFDWFANAGDVLENLEPGVANRLAADYFYIMRTRTNHRVKTVTNKFNTRSGPWTASSRAAASSSSLRRSMGDPFGFGTNPNDLSAMQLSILGALGMSKL